MILYEVAVTPDPSIFSAYTLWLEKHIKEIMTLPGFIRADLYTVENGQTLCVHYTLENQEAFDRYLAEHAPRLRKAGVEQWGGQFKAERRVLTLKGSWSS